MIKYNIMFILQYKVSTTVINLVVVFALFVFIAYLRCCVFVLLPFFSVNGDLYKAGSI